MIEASEIVELMSLRGLTQSQLADLVGVKQSTVSRWLTKGVQPDPSQQDQLRRLLDEARGAPIAEPPQSGPERHGFRVGGELPELHKGELPRDVPVRGLAMGGPSADFRFNGETIDLLRRPPSLAHRRKVYGVYVHGDSMSPAHRSGDPLYVDPDRPPRAGDDAIIELWPLDRMSDEAGEGFLKRFVKLTATEWVFEQFNPAGEMRFPKDHVKAVHRVIPWSEVIGF